MESILFIGATGSLSFGSFIIEAIINQLHRFKRVGVYNDTSRPTTPQKTQLLTRWQASGIEIVTSHGYASPDPFLGFDCVVILLGNHALNLQPQIIDLAISGGVRHFYPSEYGADLTRGENASQRYYKYKVATREHLELRTKDVPDLGWTLFLLGRLTEWSVLPHFGLDNANQTARIFGTPEGRQSLLAARDAAAYVVETLRAPLDRGNPGRLCRTFRISGSSPSYAELFEVLKDITGKEYKVTYLDLEDAVREEQEAKERGDVEAELAASHKLIQGRQGTLLPKPWDNDRFLQVGTPTNVRLALSDAFQSEGFRSAYGLGTNPR